MPSSLGSLTLALFIVIVGFFGSKGLMLLLNLKFVNKDIELMVWVMMWIALTASIAFIVSKVLY